jgi:alkanesulfonate monooxygenase SsuD/methylene tetrahydromethanopterin reductase-like flavin-dependent oxidoreductase (luciferase family)
MTPRERDGGQRILKDTVDLVRLAEDAGFETAWFAEHHFSNYSVCASPLMMAAHCAPVTSRINLGTAVLVLPLYHPVRMVEEIGLVDLLSDGRLVVGIGTGYQAFEFNRFGVDIDQRLERTLEVLDILDACFSGEDIVHDGRHYRIERAPLCARPAYNRKPQIYVAGGQPELVSRAAQRGHVPFVTVGFQGTEALVKQRQYYEKLYAAAGQNADELPLAVQRYVYVTDSQADAIDAAERILYVNRLALSLRYGYQELDGPMLRPIPFKDEPTAEQIVDNVIMGDPQHCAERIADECRLLRPLHYSCIMQFGGMDGRRARRSLERFASEVMPLLEPEGRAEVTAAARTSSGPR